MVDWSGWSELEESFTEDGAVQGDLTSGGDLAERTFASIATE